MTDRADLVVVGAGTVGGWASVFAAEAGVGRVVVLERGLAGMRRLVPRGRHRPRPGRHARDRRARALVDRLLPRPGGDLRHRFRLSRARLPDPRGDRGGRAARARARRDAARRRPDGRPLAGRRGGGRDGRHALAGWPSGRQLPRRRRPHRPAAQRPRLLAGDAGGRRRAPRADGVHGPAHERRRRARDRRRDDRRRHRDRARAPDGRALAAVRRLAGRATDPGRRRAPHGRRARAARRVRRRADADGLRSWQPASTGASRKAGCCSAGAIRTRRRGRRARSTGRRTSATGSDSPGSCRSRADLGLRKIWAATIDYTPDHLPILGPALRPDGSVIGGVTIASAAGHGMMWGPGVARVAADLAVHGATSLIDVDGLRPGPLRRARPQPARARFGGAAVPGRAD